MITNYPIYRFLTRHPSLPLLIYLTLAAVLCLITVFPLLDMVERFGARNASSETLARLDERAHVSSEPGGIAQSWPPGSPFLEGQTITLASAALLQRMTSAITRAGGSVISTEVEPQHRQSNDRLLRAIASIELEQPALQQLLYDLEAGMPFLCVDQLSVQAPTNDGGRLRVLLAVSGLWRGEE